MTDVEKLIAIASGEASTSYERRNAIADLGKQEDGKTLEALAGLLAVDDRYLRRDVVKAIGTHGSPSAVLALIQCLSDQTENIRRDAASLLGTRNDGRAIGALTNLLEDKGYAVRHAAESALELLEREGIKPIDVAPETLATFGLMSNPAHDSVSDAPNSQSTQQPQNVDSASETDNAAPSPTQPDQPEDQSSANSVLPTTEDEGHTSHAHNGANSTSNEATPQRQPNLHKSTNPRSQEPAKHEFSDTVLESTTSSTTKSPSEPYVTDRSEEEHTPSSTKSQADENGEQHLEEEIVLAELVSNEPKPEPDETHIEFAGFDQRHAKTDIHKYFLPAPSDDFDWKNATRFTQFFSANLTTVKSLYTALGKQQKSAIAADAEFETATLKHNLDYANLADDLKHNKDDTIATTSSLTQLKNQDHVISQSLSKTRRTSTSITSAIANVFWPTRMESLEQRETDLNWKRKQLTLKTKELTEKLLALKVASPSITNPLTDSEKTLLAASEASATEHQKLSQIRTEINDAILSVLNSDAQSAPNRHIDELSNDSFSKATLRHCVEELHQHQAEHSVLSTELLSLESPLNQDKQRFTKAASEIASAFADGFNHEPLDRKVTSHINCAVAFRSATVASSPTHRLQGKVHGNAELTAKYRIEEITWKGEKRLGKSIKTLNKSVSQLGTLQALHAIRSAELLSSANSIHDCISYIRTELEKDFTVTR